MMKVMTTDMFITIGDKTSVTTGEYFVLETDKVQQMLEKVAKGENETKLRKQLIKNGGRNESI